MDRKIHSILLLLDGGRLLSMGILQQQHRDIDEILADDQIHTKIRELKDSGRISDEHFHLMFPPTDLSQWDTTITSRFLKHCIDLEEQPRTIMDELHELRSKVMEMYQQQGMSDEECKSVLKRIVNILEKGKTFFNGPIVRVIDKTINRMKTTTVTPEDMDRVKNWYDSETKYEDTDTSYPVIHDAAYQGKLSTLEYITNNFSDRLLEQDKNGNQAVHSAAAGGHINCFRYLIEQGLDPYQSNITHGHSLLYKAIMGNCVEIVECICQDYADMLSESDTNDWMSLHIAAKRNPDIGRCLIKSGVDITLRNKRGMNVLHVAASEGSIDFIRMFVDEVQDKKLLKALKQTRTNDGLTVGHVAVSAGYLNCLIILVEYGIDPMTKSDTGHTLLHTAAHEGFLYIVKYLNETYPDLKSEKDEKGMSALFSAVHGKRIECLKYLIRQGMITDTRSKYGDTLLHTAAFGGSVSTVKYLCETFSELKNKTDNKGMDALHNAAISGSLDCLIYLIGQDMKTDTRCNYGSTILHEAAYGGSVSTVKYIYEIFPELILLRKFDGVDALHCAALGRSLDCLKYLISKGMKTDTRSNKGNTLLHAAAYGGSVSLVRYIWKKYPELKYEITKKGQDAIHCAALGMSLDCMKYLILQYKTDNKGADALHTAVRGGNVDCVKYLISQGLETDTRCKKGYTLLHEAAYGGSVSMLQYIWESFPELNKVRSVTGQDALHSAACGGSLDCLVYLFDEGMKIDMQSKYGQSILHQAVYRGHGGVVRYLCDNFDQHFGYKQPDDQRAMFSAVCGGHLDILKYLLSQKIDPQLTNKKGHTILHAAARGGKTDIVRFLCTNYRFLIPLKAITGETARKLAHINGRFDCVHVMDKRF